VGGVLGFAAYASHNMVLFGVVVGVVALGFVLTMFYIAVWWGLTATEVMVQDSKTDVMGALKKVRPLLWSYMGVQGLFALLLLGLLPFVIFSVGIVGFLWSFWAVFLPFAYLLKGKRGINALWYSRDLFNQKFWPVAGRMILVTVVIIAIQSVLGFTRNNSLHVLSWLVSLFTSPFVISYNYEIFKNLDQSKEGKRPNGWIIASVIGGVISLVLIVSLVMAGAHNLPNMMKQNEFVPPVKPLHKTNTNEI
jgi:hypothetical protein